MKRSIELLGALVKCIEKQWDARFVLTQQPLLSPSFCPHRTLLFLSIASSQPLPFTALLSVFMSFSLHSPLPLVSGCAKRFFIAFCDGAFGKRLPRALWGLTAGQQISELGFIRARKMRDSNSVFFGWTVRFWQEFCKSPAVLLQRVIHEEKSV